MLINSLTGPEFEAYVASLLEHHGYEVMGTKATRDFGVDLVARKGTDVLAVQCKRWIAPVGPEAVQQVVAGAAMYECTGTMVVSNNNFTAAAVALARHNNCALIDGVGLEQLAAGWQPEKGIAYAYIPDRTRAGVFHQALSKPRQASWEKAMSEKLCGSAYATVGSAEAVARELGAGEIRPEHLLVGVLGSAGRRLSGVVGRCGLTADAIRNRLAYTDRPEESFEADAQALRAIGIDLHAIRAAVDRNFGAGTYDNALRKSGRSVRRRRHLLFTKPAKEVLELAWREALAHKDNWIDCEHIVLGILGGGDKFTLGLINEHVDTAQLRSEVVGLLDEAA